MKSIDVCIKHLTHTPATWLITGVGGFIGSHLLECLLGQNQKVIGLDNFVTGSRANLESVKASVLPSQWQRFALMEGTIVDPDTCLAACSGVDFVLHQAALASIPRSFAQPRAIAETNILGTLNIIEAAAAQKVTRLVIASSSSVYGDIDDAVKRENRLGTLISPYAISKRVNEQMAGVLAPHLGLSIVALRYFNVFGPRQSPDGPYAAVIPKWLDLMRQNKQIQIYGTGGTSRDFCYVSNVVEANILAACTDTGENFSVFNVARGESTSLTELFNAAKQILHEQYDHDYTAAPAHLDFRFGDIYRSEACIDAIRASLGYEGPISLFDGLARTISWSFTTC